MNRMEPKILIVEDDRNLGCLLRDYLNSEGFEAYWAGLPQIGWKILSQQDIDLCILDVMMPDIDGFTLAKRIKSKYANIPFLFLTARIMRNDKLKGFAVGADDYITKPFDEAELVCRIKAILNRKVAQIPKLESKTFQIGNYTYRPDMLEISINEEIIRLTEKENAVLCLLLRFKNQLLKREEALKIIYGKADYFLGRSFDVFITKLRKILSQDDRIKIENVFKVGFILRIPEEQTSSSNSQDDRDIYNPESYPN